MIIFIKDKVIKKR